MFNIMTLKFIYVAMCFFIAGLSYFRCCNKKDWAWLTAGLLFTVGADYFLVLHNNHLPGVAVFCFVHVCYILRGLNGTRRQQVVLFAVPFLTLSIFIAFVNGALPVLAGIYAGLFLANIIVNIRFFKGQKNAPQALPKLNKGLVLAGLILFALCDINVLLFNLPTQLGVDISFPFAFSLIWVFYLPSQLLLAVSAVSMTKPIKKLKPPQHPPGQKSISTLP